MRTLQLLGVLFFMFGCGYSESDGRAGVERVLRETPRLAQLAFDLKEAPQSRYNETGRFPELFGDVVLEQFKFKKLGKDEYEASTVAKLSAGPSLPEGTTGTRTLELTVSFRIRRWPPPIIFLPESETLEPSTWTLRAVNGRAIAETDFFREFLVQ